MHSECIVGGLFPRRQRLDFTRNAPASSGIPALLLLDVESATFDKLKGCMVLLYCRDVFMEKHWKSVIHRSICDYFFEAQSKVCGSVSGLSDGVMFGVGGTASLMRLIDYFTACTLNSLFVNTVLSLYWRSKCSFESICP